MKLKTKIKNAVRRNERRMTTKKAKRAQKYIALSIAFMLAITALINWANSSTVISIDNSKNWDARKAVESSKAQPETQDEAKDGVVAVTKEEAVVQSSPSSEVVRMIEEKFPENPKLMVAIARAESGLNPYATNKNKNGSVDTGIFQINSVHGHDQLELTKIEKNIEVARKVYEKQGLGAWVAYTNGSFKKFL